MARGPMTPPATQKGSAKMSAFDRSVEKLAKNTVTVRKGGETVELSMTDALLESQLKTALSGSPHAQRQVIENIRKAEAARQAIIDEDVKVWSFYKETRTAEIEKARADEEPIPLIIPHPDDVIIDEEKGVRFDGPVTKEEHRQVLKCKALVDALLLQDALDRRRRKSKVVTDVKLGDPFMSAILMNKSLPGRLAYSADDIMLRRIRLMSVSQRELLKQTHQAYKRAGMDVPRGAAAVPPDLMVRIMRMSDEVARIAADKTLDTRRKAEQVDLILRRYFG